MGEAWSRAVRRGNPGWLMQGGRPEGAALACTLTPWLIWEAPASMRGAPDHDAPQTMEWLLSEWKQQRAHCNAAMDDGH
eukprot:3552636-Amphidinium_carterae.1